MHKKEKENNNLGKTQGKDKQVTEYSIGPITRETTRSSKVEALFKGTGMISDEKDYHYAYLPLQLSTIVPVALIEYVLV